MWHLWSWLVRLSKWVAPAMFALKCSLIDPRKNRVTRPLFSLPSTWMGKLASNRSAWRLRLRGPLPSCCNARSNDTAGAGRIRARTTWSKPKAPRHGAQMSEHGRRHIACHVNMLGSYRTHGATGDSSVGIFPGFRLAGGCQVVSWR